MSLKVAYADPPYPGQARKHYKDDPQCAEVDHAALIARLELDYPDGWALSTSSTALQMVLALCPSGVRIGAWVKPFAVFRPGVNPCYAWEPVIFRGGRTKRSRTDPTLFDWVSTPITMKRGVHGAKPEPFCFWLFSMLGLRPGDTLDDLFPGSRAVSRAWQRWQSQLWKDEAYSA